MLVNLSFLWSTKFNTSIKHFSLNIEGSKSKKKKEIKKKINNYRGLMTVYVWNV